ncbi:hypothetical protein EIP91_003545 [Steccherinum ochraceum]|uniref:Protein kinase domain-containing protein n=1 Tax=Steccherinum ochraceum TaxID=92696 RepID=A0A4R0RIV3_9APHY|nr:hypothetical protein EIP91_003545 [Steccherinum ochraceum]
MLQYPVQLPPLSLSSSKKHAPTNQAPRDVSDDPRSNGAAHGHPNHFASSTTSSSTTGSLINAKRSHNFSIITHDKPHPQHHRQTPTPAYAAFSHPHAMPLSIATASYRTASPSPSSPSFPVASPALASASPSSKPIPVPPSPSLYTNKPMPRSPLVVSRQLPSPGMSNRPLPGSPVLSPRSQLASPTFASRSPHPLMATNLPSILDDEPSIVGLRSAPGSRPSTGTVSRPGTATRPSTATTARLSRTGTATRPTSVVHSATRSSSHDSLFSQASSNSLADVLCQGDLVGDGLTLQGELIRRVPITPHSSAASMFSRDDLSLDEEIRSERERIPAKEFEVVRKLGTGSYAVVYLVREVLSRGGSMLSSPTVSSEDGHGVAAVGSMDMSDDGHFREEEDRVYGREYAIKVLSKANLDQGELEAQLFEATIHQTLRSHPNIVTLHRTLESPSFLFLLLEFVPGEDLFYFLEQSRDHFSPAAPASPSTSPSSPSIEEASSASSGSGHTPPTPSLLSSIHPTHLLSQTRLKLIASMFGQMCDAVASCHEQSIFHRDIKPENFIVTDGWHDKEGRDGTVTKERKVVVKLTDFGLGTMDAESADMDCGSAPYMSFECRNNIHPTYSPRAADVWSLGIVLINMLYHCNPWSDTTLGACSAFETYRSQPIPFFMTRFTGLTYPVADFLASRVFCLLEDPHDDSARITAAEFGRWVRDLPSMLGTSERPGHSRTMSTSSVVGYTLASVPASRRPSLRPDGRTSWVMGSASRVPSVRTSWALSRNPSFGIGPVSDLLPESLVEGSVLPPVIDQEVEPEPDLQIEEVDAAEAPEQESKSNSRSASTQKRRKRGARKGKGAASSSSLGGSPTPAVDDQILNTLAEASQALAREISRTSKGSAAMQTQHGLSRLELVDASGQSSPHSFPHVSATSSSSDAAPAAPPAPITKKPSKWKLGFGRSSHSSQSDRSANAVAPAKAAPPPPPSIPEAPSAPTSLVSLQSSTSMPMPSLKLPSLIIKSLKTIRLLGVAVVGPPRVPGGSLYSGSNASSTWGPSGAASAFGATGPYAHGHSNGSNPNWNASGTEAPSSISHHISNNPVAASSSAVVYAQSQQQHLQPVPAPAPRNASPTSTRSGRPLASSASSLASNTSNWRSSLDVQYGYGEQQHDWRSGGSKYPYNYDTPGQLPPNVKLVTGTPWELDQLPRQMYANPEDARFGQPPPRKRRVPKGKDSKLDSVNKLDTINEWPHQKSPLGQRSDAATSTTDLDRAARDSGSGEDDPLGTSPRKVQKGQINALAKMLSALRR